MTKGSTKGTSRVSWRGTEVATVGGMEQEQRFSPRQAGTAGGLGGGPLSTLKRMPGVCFPNRAMVQGHFLSDFWNNFQRRCK